MIKQKNNEKPAGVWPFFSLSFYIIGVCVGKRENIGVLGLSLFSTDGDSTWLC